MDQLFSQEVISQFLELMQSATEGGVTFAIVWLLVPLFMLMVTSLAWLLGVYYIVKGTTAAVSQYFHTKKEIALAPPPPLKYELKGKFINDDVRQRITSLIINLSDTSFIHDSDVSALESVWYKHLEKEERAAAARKKRLGLEDD